MAASISQQLEELLNPLPTFADPEDDPDEETKARVIDKFDEGGNDDDKDLQSGGLRKRAPTLLADTDKRYQGKAVSRKQLREEADGSADDDDDDDDEDLDNEELGEDLEDEEESVEGDEEEDEDDEDEDLNEDDSSQMSSLATKMKRTDLNIPKEIDFRKFTEGMDDLGESDSEEDGELDEGESEEEEGEDNDDDGEDDEEEGDEDDSGGVMTFSKQKVDEEVEKGQAVKSQLALWDQLLEGRIKMQKALVMANQLPQPNTFPEFQSKGGAEYAGALKNSHKALKALQRSLLELQDLLLYQNPDTRAISQGKTWGSDSKAEEDEEINSDEDEDEEEERHTGLNRPPKRKLNMTDYPDFMAKRFAAFQPYRDATLQKWYDKTRLTMGKTNKGFGAFERNILTQVEQVMMDKERLLRRTQTRRSDYRVLGKPELAVTNTNPSTTDPEATDLPLKANAHLKDLDEEIFDDDDFYHQLLRELIERKTSAADPNDQVAMGRQWLAIQKLRSKIKKKVDTKASKGRKIRFHIHSKLVNFMAPIDNSAMSDEARSELYRSLFGSQMVH